MTMAVTKAVEEGSRAVICASTGNTSASAAAYAARAGITAFVLIPEGKIALGKLAQAMIHGAVVLQIRGNFDAGMKLVKEVADHAPVTIVNKLGLHARPSAQLVTVASRFRSQVYISKNSLRVNGKSIMGVLTLAAATGTELTIKADGADEQQAVDALVLLINNRFGEDE